MTLEDKELLLRDLCAKLPYGVHCCVLNLNKTIKEDNDIIYGIVGDNIVTLKSDKNKCYMYYQIKPYLRPISSITEEEKEEIKPFFSEFKDEFGKRVLVVGQNKMFLYQDWLNAHHFDYRELIKKGLAIAVTNENNPYK